MNIISQIQRLRQRKHRRATGLFLVEGIAPVSQAISAEQPLEYIYYSPEQLTSPFAQQLVADQQRKGIPCHALDRKTFSAISAKENPVGLLAVGRQKTTDLPSVVIEVAPSQPTVALVTPQDPGNVGTILRTMDAIGKSTLFLLEGGVDAYHPECLRASMGAAFHHTIVTADFATFLTWSHNQKAYLVGTSARGGKEYREWHRDPEVTTILLLGNEQTGLTPPQQQACHAMLRLPMRGRVSSLNIAVAAGILLYHLYP